MPLAAEVVKEALYASHSYNQRKNKSACAVAGTASFIVGGDLCDAAWRPPAQDRVNTNRVQRNGKFFRLGEEKFYVKGVTYGPFKPDADGLCLPTIEQVRKDFAQLREMGANCLRIYHLPPTWFLDLAEKMGLRILLDVCWPKNLNFVGNPEVTGQACEAVREAARKCGNHPAVFAISVVNEIPADIVRFTGAKKIEDFIDESGRRRQSRGSRLPVHFRQFPDDRIPAPAQASTSSASTSICMMKRRSEITWPGCRMIAGEMPLHARRIWDRHASTNIQKRSRRRFSTARSAPIYDEGTRWHVCLRLYR